MEVLQDGHVDVRDGGRTVAALLLPGGQVHRGKVWAPIAVLGRSLRATLAIHHRGGLRQLLASPMAAQWMVV